MNGRGMAVLIAWFLVIVALCACTAQPPGGQAQSPAVRIVATQDFGRQLMFDEKLELEPGTSAMAALKRVAEVETAYGGGFVDAINGLRSGFTSGQSAKADWFFYINGIQSNIGALDYRLHDGDVQHWDFHDWSFRHFIPAIIDGFPAALSNGFGGKVSPNLIVYQDSMKESAQKLAEKLVKLGVNNISLRSFGE